MDAVQDPGPVPPPAGGFKKVFSRSSNRSQTSQGQDLESVASSGRSNGRSSVDSTPERRGVTGGDVGDDSPNRLSKLLGSRRRKKNNNTLTAAIPPADLPLDKSANGSAPSPSQEFPASGSSTNGSVSAVDQSGSIHLLTDDSEPDMTLPLVSCDSHTGYLTASSPLITTTSVYGEEDNGGSIKSWSSSRRHSISVSGNTTGRLGVTETESGRQSSGSSKKRGVSPARRLKDAFKPSQNKKSPDVSPDRDSSPSSDSRRPSLLGRSSRRSSLSEKRASRRAESPPPPLPALVLTNTPANTTEPSDTIQPVKTPPSKSGLEMVTTLTPPTPPPARKGFAPELTNSPESIASRNSDKFPPGTTVSPSGNMISHRRVRSAGAVSHSPSKLSHSTILTPTLEEPRPSASRNPSASQNGFFSSVFSAAQNAASTLSSSLSAPNKNRSVTQPVDTDSSAVPSTDGATDDQGASSNQSMSEQGPKEEQDKLAVNTLGSGDLDFSHLDIDTPASGVVSVKDGVVITQPDLSAEARKFAVAARRDEMSARIEDLRAARAVSMAYEKTSSRPTTPTGAALDDGTLVTDARSTATPLSKEISGEQTTPGGSVYEGETGGTIRRTGSVRSRLARRHRNSSGATGSTIGVMGLNAMSLAMPTANSSVPRLTGFAVASKKRNRDFHQLFRSVPEDDFLIEDYSCALQREIILAGRIYISEGHICFSSNILGWVTTLVISFDEIVAIEKENTAMVFPNAIAIQTLHARHTFRSLLSREATYDLMVNIWKINHPSLRSYVNGIRIDDGLGDKTEKAEESDEGSDEGDDDDEIYDEDEDNEGGSFQDAGEGSVTGSELTESVKQLGQKSSVSMANGLSLTVSAPALSSLADSKHPDKSGVSGGDSGGGFPGPVTHPPTEFNDSSARYDKVVKDDNIPAPLGKVFNMVFGPASGAFMIKFLLEDQKCLELQFEDDKKGLTNENKTRQYSYIKPLNSSIGPKQTKCISVETLDVLDLEKAVLVTLSTQTPDVPSGNVFSVKTKYLFTWAANNQTRFLMTCTIEWSGKSWLKGPIEKGAIDGQTAFGNDLVKALKAAVASRANGISKGAKGTKGRRKKGSGSPDEKTAAAADSAAHKAGEGDSGGWGLLEPLRGPLGPVVSIFKPIWSAHVALGIIGFLLFTIYSRGRAGSSDVVYGGLSTPQRLAAYEEMWRREETDLWDWLEDRVGLDGIGVPQAGQPHDSRAQQRLRRQRLRSKDSVSKLNEERMSEREVDHAIRVTRERLDVLEDLVHARKDQRRGAETLTSVAEGEHW